MGHDDEHGSIDAQRFLPAGYPVKHGSDAKDATNAACAAAAVHG